MKKETIEYIAIDKFICEPQVRDLLDPEKIEELARSIEAVGLLSPIRARRTVEHFIPIDGHYRLAAVRLLQWKTIATIVEDAELDEGAIIHRMLIANCQRTDLTLIQTARGVEQLIKTTGWTASQAATQLGFSNSKVSDMRGVMSLPASIIEQVETGKIAFSAAADLARVDDPARQAELAQQFAEGRLTRDGLVGARKAGKRSADDGNGRPTRVTAMLGKGNSVTVAGDALTLERFIETMEKVLGKARRVRSQGVELGTFIKMLRDQARGDDA